jgi:hypothetical protein
MNEVIRAITARRSIRKFSPELPAKDIISQVVEAGTWAASGMGRQDPVILVITKKELRDRISAANCRIGGWDEGFDPFYGAPVILAVLSPKGHVTAVEDGSLVLGSMMLAAHSLGLGSVWIHRAKEEFETEEFKALLADLGITEEMAGIGHLALGYAEGEPPAPAPRKPGRVFYIE